MLLKSFFLTNFPQEDGQVIFNCIGVCDGSAVVASVSTTSLYFLVSFLGSKPA